MFKRVTLFFIIFGALSCSQPVKKAVVANETTYSQYAEQFGTTSAIYAWASYYAKCIAEVHSVAVIEQGINRIFSSFFKSNSRIVNKAILKKSLYLQVKNQPEIIQRLDETVEAVTSIVGDKAISDEIIKRVINSSSKFISGQNSKSSFDDFLNVLRKEVDEFAGSVGKDVKNLIDETLIAEMKRSGIKFTEGDLKWIFKNNDGKILFLEKGNTSAGLEHILLHKRDFMAKGITETDISDFIMQAITKNTVVGYQGADTTRPIYELVYNGLKHRVAITIGSNGFVVGANPVSF